MSLLTPALNLNWSWNHASWIKTMFDSIEASYFNLVHFDLAPSNNLVHLVILPNLIGRFYLPHRINPWNHSSLIWLELILFHNNTKNDLSRVKVQQCSLHWFLDFCPISEQKQHYTLRSNLQWTKPTHCSYARHLVVMWGAKNRRGGYTSKKCLSHTPK